MAHRVLIVEDETDIARSLVYSFERDGWETRTVVNGESGLTEARLWGPDLIILDIILPDVDGFEVCRRMRKESSVPIIMLTAKTAEIDRVVGLELGADDYVVKPFSTRELLARARAIMRRTQGTEGPFTETRIEAGDLVINRQMRVVTLAGREIEFRLKEYDLLCLLADNPGRTLTRRTIFQKVWGDGLSTDSRTLDVHIRWLREKIEADPSNPRMLLTVRGVGYKFVPQSSTPGAPGSPSADASPASHILGESPCLMDPEGSGGVSAGPPAAGQ